MNRGESGERSGLCAESCSDEINGRNGLVQMEDRGGQRKLAREAETITPPRGFWDRVRGRRAWTRFISEAPLAFKLRALVPAFIAPLVCSHNLLHYNSLSLFIPVTVKLSRPLSLSSCVQVLMVIGVCVHAPE